MPVMLRMLSEVEVFSRVSTQRRKGVMDRVLVAGSKVFRESCRTADMVKFWVWRSVIMSWVEVSGGRPLSMTLVVDLGEGS